jgi:tetratricopeptide (TPR) repeat protein
MSSSCRKFFVVLASFFLCFLTLSLAMAAQVSRSEQVQVRPPLLVSVDPPAKDATVAQLDQRGDELRIQKLYLDALDYYRAALVKEPNSAKLLNKMGITELMMQRYREARKSFEKSIKADHNFADAYNNLGVVMYEDKKFPAAIKEYRRAVAIDGTAASFYSNLGAALFSKKEFEPAVRAYQQALEIDPDVFERSSRGGVQAQLPKPEDRARYDFTVAKLYAKMGFSEQSLEYLRKAMEEGYKDFNDVYKDIEFATLRKDKRFTELVATRTTVLPE